MNAQELYKCMLCKKRHALRFCPQFILMTVEDRRAAVRQHRYCRNCLAKSHSVVECQSTDTCRKCGFQHHTMLHPRKLVLKSKSSNAASKSHSSNQPTSSRPQRNPAAQSNATAKSRLGQRQHSASAGQQQQQQRRAKRHNKPKGQRSHQQQPPKHQRKLKTQKSNKERPLTSQPNYLILSEAIKSLATVLCASPNLAQAQGRRHGQI
ncbi:uncharacterized protein LOC131994977 [Stomoxys calcitrans]|uniref:uncharacterized protein LOC131994977 n=1 Tax=Stomoxys calcitrans TaxID=35570 RepID=UPI0027E2EC3C|nr:uncharacterized protein LOC131994977 [Stomoxys calcitrans]